MIHQFIDDLYKDFDEQCMITLMQIDEEKATNNYISKDELMSSLEYLDGIEDMYVSMNTFWNKREQRSEKNLRKINALYTDIDYYKNDLTQDYVINELKNLIPFKPSYLIDSGRGLYSIWLIESTPKQTKGLFNSIQKEIQYRLKHLGADANALDASRVLRLPSTLNSKNNAEVSIIESNETRYKLTDFTKLLRWSQDEVQTYKKKKAISQKVIKLDDKRIKDLDKLHTLRDFKDGQLRNEYLFIYKNELLKLGVDLNQIISKVHSINDAFNDPLDIKEVDTLLSYTATIYKMKNTTIIKKLQITEEEQLKLSVLCGAKLKKARKRSSKRKKVFGRSKKQYSIFNRRARLATLMALEYEQKEIMRLLNISRSTYYDDKKYIEENIVLFNQYIKGIKTYIKQTFKDVMSCFDLYEFEADRVVVLDSG